MKLKFYLRGLGIGILVTTVILGIASGRKQNMSDEEVIKRARELGMVESTLLTNLPDQGKEETQPEESEMQETKPEETKPEESKAEETKPDETKPEESKAEETKPDETKPEESKAEETKPEESQPEETQNKETDKMVSIVITKGESSTSVSKSLQKAGLVEDAAAFDKYLCANGYDKKIVTGTYEIPIGASEEEIAHLITRR